MTINYRNVSALLLAAAFAFSVSGCNTMKGVGKDTQAAGKKIEKEADEHKHHDND